MENIYKSVLEGLEQGNHVEIETIFAGKEGSLTKDFCRNIHVFSPEESQQKIAPAFLAEEKNIMKEPLTPKERLIILGGGHIALPLCSFGARCGFSVTVVDDRPTFANSHRFSEAKQVICDSFPQAILNLKITPYDYVVIITRGHRHDGDCLRVLLKEEESAYLGMIGSKRRVRELLDVLEGEGFLRERMNHICTPIGLSIGGVTPEEIAISIMAEVIAYKRLAEKSQAKKVRLANESDLDLEVIHHLSNQKEPLSAVTILATKGSTPRKAGAKMTVNQLGQITGSIGGGCSEGAVIRDAIAIIGTGTYKMMHIDMTGDVAEEDGMVCGGTMEVLLEDVPYNG